LLVYSSLFSGKPVSTEDLNEVAELSGVMSYGNDHLEPNLRANCECIIPEVGKVLSSDAADSFLFLKDHYRNQNQ
jgi:hypothetical protein